MMIKLKKKRLKNQLSKIIVSIVAVYNISSVQPFQELLTIICTYNNLFIVGAQDIWSDEITKCMLDTYVEYLPQVGPMKKYLKKNVYVEINC